MVNEDTTFPDYITFPRTFEKYKWYKPILVLITGLISYAILLGLIYAIFGTIYGWNTVIMAVKGGYSSINTSDVASYVSYLSIGALIPSIYIASRIVRDRPFSSYSSSRGGWNWKLYFKCLTIPLVLYLIYSVGLIAYHGKIGSTEITYLSLILCLVLIPIQCIAEEYVFRGFIMQTFGSWFKIPILGLIMQAVIFTALHPYNLIGVSAIFVSGIVLGVLAWKTNGLEAGGALHSINNLNSFYLVALGFDTLSEAIPIADLLFGIILTIASAALLYYIGNKRSWFSEKTTER